MYSRMWHFGAILGKSLDFPVFGLANDRLAQYVKPSLTDRKHINLDIL